VNPKHATFACKKQNHVLYILAVAKLNRGFAAAVVEKKENERSERSETFCTQLETRVDFFYFFARNPLKSPDSDEQIQGNPSFFAWFYLDLLGRNSRSG
jgi:hypothetical protein